MHSTVVTARMNGDAKGEQVAKHDVNKRGTILHFSNASVRAGAEQHMLMLLTRLDRARFRPMLVAHPKLIELLRADLPSDVDPIPVVLDGPRDLTGALRFIRILRDERVDIVHSHMFQASRVASPLAWLAGVPVRVETPHVRESWRHGWVKGNYAIDRLVGRFVTAYIAVSESNSKYLIKEKRLPSDKVFVVRNGIPLQQFDPDRVAPPELRRSLRIREDTPVVVAIARLEPQKGHRVLLEAWRSVTDSFPHARLVCLGDGALRTELEAYTVASGIAGSVSFTGYQSNVADWLALADFTVLPSFFEGLPLAALESLAAGRAVVGTAVDGTTEVVIDGKTGLLVSPGSAGLLATAICQLISSPGLARRLGRAGRRLVAGHFTEHRQVEQTQALYEAALGLRARLTPLCGVTSAREA